jgi:acyl-CoA thioester hydrolase
MKSDLIKYCHDSNNPGQGWFEQQIQVYPHHTDYAGIVWHGTYLQWFEEARVEALRSAGVAFVDLVEMGCDLPVVDLSIRYHRSPTMGLIVVLKSRLLPIKGVRIPWDYELRSLDGQTLYTTATVTLVALDRSKGTVLRRLPGLLQEALGRFGSRE